MDIFKKRLKWAREQKRYTQAQLSKELSISLSGYRKFEYEGRVPKVEILLELSKLLGVGIEFLLGVKHETLEMESMKLGIISKLTPLLTYKEILSENEQAKLNKISGGEVEAIMEIIEDEFEDSTRKYIMMLVEIPEAKADDEVFMYLSPFSIKILDTLFNTYLVCMYTTDSELAINFAEFKVFDEANEFARKLKRILGQDDVNSIKDRVKAIIARN